MHVSLDESLTGAGGIVVGSGASKPAAAVIAAEDAVDLNLASVCVSLDESSDAVGLNLASVCAILDDAIGADNLNLGLDLASA